MKETKSTICQYGRAKITVRITWSDESGEETVYVNPLTNSPCQEIAQILQGWSEQDESAQHEWELLIDSIVDDDMLADRIYQGEKLIDYTPREWESLDALYVDVKSGNIPETRDWSSFPTFGGDEPESTVGVWSWDETRLMVGTCADDMQLILRNQEQHS